MKKVFILGYHSIARLGYRHSVYPEVFERQMAHIQKHYEVLSLNDFIKVFQGERKLERNAVLVTFDDGLQDNYINAYPILKKYNIPAVIFMVTGLAGKDHSGPSGYTFRFLNWDEMKEMEESGLVSIESHTYMHPVLTQVDPQELEDELKQSKDDIQTQLKKEVCCMAYPKGEYNDEVLDAVQNIYGYAFSVDGGYWGKYNAENPYVIPRFLVSQNIRLWKFKFMLTSVYWFLKKVRSFLQGVR